MMYHLRHTLQRISLLTNGDFLVGSVFMLSGVILVWLGGARLHDLYREFSGYFPLTLPDNVADIILSSFPLIFRTFINTVGSLCAVIMGILWALSGIAEAFEARKGWSAPPELEHPEVVAESLRSGQSLYWRSASLSVRILGRLWRRARFISPISYEMFHHVLSSTVRIVVVGIAIALIVYLLEMVPSLASRFFNVRINLLVPSADPLYSILAFLVVSNGLIAASLIPFRRPRFVRTSETVSVQGVGDPHLFFALLEEGCRLLSAEGLSRESPTRVEDVSDDRISGTLTESYPKGIASLARPAGYLCLPLVPILLWLGFSRLIDFSPALSSVHYSEFLSRHLLSYALDAALALALILAGVSFGEWARKLLGVRRFLSALVFCNLVAERNSPSVSPGKSVAANSTRQSTLVEWKIVEATDERFARWAKHPEKAGAFHTLVCWAEVVSESASEDGPRFVTEMGETDVLRDSMYRLIRLPFHVDFASASVEDGDGTSNEKLPSRRENASSGKSTSHIG